MSKKQQYNIPLYGVLSNGNMAKTHEADRVSAFHGDTDKTSGYFRVVDKVTHVVLTTPLGAYEIPWDKMLNIYKGIAEGIKIHISLKRVSGKLIYWA